ncbi:hypothetical protein Syun_026901 [Stephania yunnanensis]|uniref:DUF7032 domain-containing protein n=1 Tax=Stephania yunnanensis TaxID=152371 RepID=A0AAP0EEN4_9MAGN
MFVNCDLDHGMRAYKAPIKHKRIQSSNHVGHLSCKDLELATLISTSSTLTISHTRPDQQPPPPPHPLITDHQILHRTVASDPHKTHLPPDHPRRPRRLPHWSENPLLQDLLPTLLSSLRKSQSLSNDSHKDPSLISSKLFTQSEIDISSAHLSSHLRDLDLLLKSGVLRQSTAIVLSQPGLDSNKEEIGFFIRDLFTRLQIGGVEFKLKALESLNQLLLSRFKSAALVSKEGNVRYLIQLLESNQHSLIREQALVAVSVLASAGDSSRRSVFEEGCLGPLLRILESGCSVLKEKSAMAIEAITSDPENAWAVSAYGGVQVLLQACRSGSPATQAHAVGSIRNISCVEEMRIVFAEEQAVEVLIQLLESGSSTAKEKSANSLWILASSGENFSDSIIQHGGLQCLLRLLGESSDPDIVEHVLRAIEALTASSPIPRSILSTSTPFLLQLCDLIKQGSVATQHISASILSNLSISDNNKKTIVGCMGALIKLMESTKPVGMQELATKSLVSLLSIGLNRKEFVRDEKSLMRLVLMLDPKNESICKSFPVAVAAAVLAGGSESCRKRLVGAGAWPHLQRLSEMEVAGAKKAVKKLAGNRLKSIFSTDGDIKSIFEAYKKLPNPLHIFACVYCTYMHSTGMSQGRSGCGASTKALTNAKIIYVAVVASFFEIIPNYL